MSCCSNWERRRPRISRRSLGLDGPHGIGFALRLAWYPVFVILSLITWLHVLRYIPLSIAFPISQVVHALVPLGSWLVLGESITSVRWCGIALVLLGLAVVAKPVARLEERL